VDLVDDGPCGFFGGQGASTRTDDGSDDARYEMVRHAEITNG